MTLTEVPDIVSEEMEVNQDTITILEKFLKEAKAGKITEVILVGIHNESQLVKMSCSQTMSITKQLGALELAKANTLSHVILGSYIQTDDET